MKNLFRISILTLATALFAAGCGKDQIIGPTIPNTGTGTESGHLLLKGLNLGVSYNTETITNSSSNSQTRTSRVEADGAYLIEITDQATQTPVWTGTYAQIQDMEDPIALTQGRYTIKACSHGDIASIAWEKPEYAGQTSFTIVKRDTTEVSDLICTLANIKTSVELAADLKHLFKEDPNTPLITTLSLNDAECEFGRDETRTAFFKAPALSNTLTVTLSGLYNIKGEGEIPEYQPVTMTQTVPNVKAGQWRKIAIAMEHADNGNVQFIVKVETWVYDDQIDVNIMSTYVLGEETIPDGDEEITDPNAPVLTLEGGHNIIQPFRITESNFDMDLHTCLDRMSLVATPNASSKITDAYCVFDSDNADFLSALAAAGFADYKIELFANNQATKYAVVREDAENRLIAKVNDTGMFGLYGFAGTHTAKIVIIDDQNRRSYTPLTIEVVQGQTGVPPVIVWHGGDLDARHDIKPVMSVMIDITSKTGITGFIVEISGNLLTADELKMLNLAARMDLVNPATPEMRTALENFGFLPKDGSSIAGKTDMSFNISQLVPLLGQLGRKGPCDFKLSVTDASGTTAKTLMFQVL